MNKSSKSKKAAPKKNNSNDNDDIQEINLQLKRRIEELEQSERKYKGLFDSIIDIYYRTDMKGKITIISPSVFSIMGYTPDEMIGKSITDFYEFPNARKEFIKKLKARGKVNNFEAVIVGKDNRKIILSSNANLKYDNKGKPIYIEGIARDISKHKKIEEEITQERSLSNIIIDSLPGVFYLFDQSGKFLRWNSNFESVTGYSNEEFSKINPLDLFKGNDRKNIEENINLVFKAGKTTVEANITTKDGRKIPYYFTGRKIEFDGEPCLIGMGIDITEKKNSENALKLAEQKLRDVVEHSTNLFYSHTTDNVLTYVSPQSRYYFDCEPKEAMVRWTEFITDNPINQKGIEATQRAIETGQIQPPYELELRTKKGRNVWVEVGEAPIVYKDETIGIVGALTDITERKKVEENLIESEAKYKSIVESSPMGIFIYRLDNFDNLVLAGSNQAADEILKINSKKLFGKQILEAFPELKNTEAPEMFKKVCKEGIVWHNRQLNYKDERVSGAFDINAFRTADNTMTVMFLDVTDKIIAEEMLRKSEEKFRLLADNSIDCIWTTDINLKFTYLSPALERIMGIKPKEWIGTRITSHFRKKELLKVTKLIAKVIKNYKTHPPVTFETKMLNWKKEEVDLEISGKVLLNNKGKLIGLQGTTRNITDRKIAELQIQKFNLENKLLAEYLENSTQSFVEGTPDGKLTRVNTAFCNLTGYTEEELLKSVDWYKNLTPPDWHDKEAKIMMKLMEDKNPKRFEKEYLKKDGSRVPVELLIHGIFGTDGRLKKSYAFISEITERKKAETEIIMAKEIAENSERLKSEFLAQMSHEIRTPINAILSFSGLLKDEIGELVPDDLGNVFDIMSNAGKRIIRTIDLILNMSELQTGTFKPDLRKFDIYKDVLKPLYSQYKQLCNEKALDITISKSKGNFNINADEYSTMQIFDNLIGNAVKYTEAGKINIIAQRSGNKIIVEISDTGIGISKQYLPNLFEPFSQEEQGYTRKFEGTGLGLALVKKYCEMNNASVQCESDKGKGSKFIVTFSALRK